jgi:hypothetical protein
MPYWSVMPSKVSPPGPLTWRRAARPSVAGRGSSRPAREAEEWSCQAPLDLGRCPQYGQN